MKYEELQYEDPALPMIFRDDTRHTDIDMHIHWHEPVEVLLVREGTLRIQSNEKVCVTRPGQVVCVHSNHLHNYSASGGDARYYCLILPPEIFEGTDLFTQPLPLVADDPAAAGALREVARLWTERPPCYKAEIRGRLLQAFAALARLNGGETPDHGRRMTDIVRSAISFLENNYAREDLTLDMVADAVGVSRYYLCHTFKKVTGRTVSRFWQSVRCEKARSMLRRGATVAEAAEACGFRGQSFFTRVYKECFGVVPSKDKERYL